MVGTHFSQNKFKRFRIAELILSFPCMFVFTIYLRQKVIHFYSVVDHSEKMRAITLSNWLIWLVYAKINAQLTLESVYQKVNNLEVEMIVLKVNKLISR